VASESRPLASAEKCFEKACALNPNHANAYYQLSRIARERGERARAEELTKVLQKLHDQDRQRDQDTLTGLVQESLRGNAAVIKR